LSLNITIKSFKYWLDIRKLKIVMNTQHEIIKLETTLNNGTKTLHRSPR
jgi:hypothetical protein